MDEEIKKILEEHESRIAKLENLLKNKPESFRKGLSLKEFILSKKPEGDVQKTLVIGYFLEKYDGYTSFNMKDLENAFRTAKDNVPDNINDKVIQNIKKGYMMEAKEKKDNFKAWNLTSTGERFVENDHKKE